MDTDKGASPSVPRSKEQQSASAYPLGVLAPTQSEVADRYASNAQLVAEVGEMLRMNARQIAAYGHYGVFVHPEDLPIDYAQGMKLVEWEPPMIPDGRSCTWPACDCRRRCVPNSEQPHMVLTDDVSNAEPQRGEASNPESVSPPISVQGLEERVAKTIWECGRPERTRFEDANDRIRAAWLDTARAVLKVVQPELDRLSARRTDWLRNELQRVRRELEVEVSSLKEERAALLAALVEIRDQPPSWRFGDPPWVHWRVLAREAVSKAEGEARSPSSGDVSEVAEKAGQ